MSKSYFAALLSGMLALSPLAHATEIAQPSLYAVNAAALASAMTYCSTKHEGMLQGSSGAACFSKARNILASFGLKRWSQEIDSRCGDPARFNTCLTPEIGKLVYALNAEFNDKGI